MGQSLRVLTWNLNGCTRPGQATNAQQERAWHFLAASDADVVLLQEVSARAIPEWARERWTVVHGEVGVARKRQRWGSVIAAKLELDLVEERDVMQASPWLEHLYDYVVVATIRLPDGQHATVSSVHAPPDTVMKWVENPPPKGFRARDLKPIAFPGAELWYSDLAWGALDAHVQGGRFIVGGDWNTSRLFDVDKSFDPPIGAAFFIRARQHGWHECHGDQNEERTFLKAGSRPYQLDHLFCDRRTGRKQIGCHVWTHDLVAELTDHLPLVAEFEW
jgi:endonuclease/exonuclease/phosphatase family metal-dependent hydrolase